MIILTTGQPGHGKTLFTLHELLERTKKEPERPVYYHGIAELKLPWTLLEDPAKWYELPEGSIIVIDECQSLFRPRSNGSQVPKFVSELETHRHKGYDIYLITQHPTLVDMNVRRLVGRHMHVVRTFGAKAATVHEFQSCKDNCDKSRKDSVKHIWKYPASVFDLYKSATLHTHSARIPAKLIMLVILPFVIVGLGYLSYKSLMGSVDKAKVAKNQETQQTTKAPSPAAVSQQGQGKSPPMTPEQYIASFQPRIPDLPHSAPRYDEVTKPVRAPIPVACISSRSKCTCYSQQGTPLQIADSVCRQFVKNGFFRDFDEQAPQNQQQQQNQPIQANNGSPNEKDHGPFFTNSGSSDPLSLDPRHNPKEVDPRVTSAQSSPARSG